MFETILLTSSETVSPAVRARYYDTAAFFTRRPEAGQHS